MRSLVPVLASAAVFLVCGACGSSSTNAASPDPGVDGAAPAPAIDTTPDDMEPAVPDPPEASAPPSSMPAALVPGCTAKGSLAGYPAWIFFTRPDKPCTGAAGSGLDSHALDELTRLIASVPAGGRIDGHIFSISVDSVAKALVDAQKRGVDVWISTDGAVGTSTDTAKTAQLDQLTHKVYCTSANRTSCVSTANSAISHTKLFVFSTATSPDGIVAKDVVWFGSANQTYASGMRLYNNTVTVYGDNGLFTKLRSYLDDLYERRTQSDYYDPAGRGHLLTDSADVYVSPEQQTDLVVNRLDDITPDTSCEVRVIQASVRDSRMVVVTRLVALKQGGCKVSVVADTVEPNALAALKSAGITVRHKPIHDKTFIVHARYGAAAYENRVYTGSHNLSGGSAHSYDEIFVKLAAESDTARPVYDAYVTHFADAFDDAPPAN